MPADASQSAPLLEARDLSRPPLGPVSLTLGAGRCLAVTGPSGAGKSLLLRALADLDPAEGTVLFQGTERRTLPAPEWRRRVCYVAADSGWWAETVAEHMPADKAAWRPLMQAVGLSDAADWPVSRLSSGERQRLSVVRALARRPAVLLLDEPTANLDAEAAATVEALIRHALDDGTGIILTSHDPAQVDRLADHRLRLRAGHMEPAP
ncbi:putative ATP-binding protein [Caenispirillum salinarum AK4]|uniref:Putative ATP-binding protein n=1 Tax=Caenispirillum salinarum AK4 TaxID=1238182 RepID=K9HR68_9PROT|nr:ABC transporter ATP-binding protein [Caenispirillum salinarum]EKV30921.1 putative ATP-binding protein [Caenispirillum salinarum AK4]